MAMTEAFTATLRALRMPFEIEGEMPNETQRLQTREKRPPFRECGPVESVLRNAVKIGPFRIFLSWKPVSPFIDRY